ncbi:hypothetical protein AYO44_06705 [Planctomycetaceae bacterium SCGC AG-212-F19]|nr:hypothetical protein AYO44_06705 [Planctomycetaceae bacterium SCGC AG-212-F19]
MHKLEREGGGQGRVRGYLLAITSLTVPSAVLLYLLWPTTDPMHATEIRIRHYDFSGSKPKYEEVMVTDPASVSKILTSLQGTPGLIGNHAFGRGELEVSFERRGRCILDGNLLEPRLLQEKTNPYRQFHLPSDAFHDVVLECFQAGRKISTNP